MWSLEKNSGAVCLPSRSHLRLFSFPIVPHVQMFTVMKEDYILFSHLPFFPQNMILQEINTLSNRDVHAILQKFFQNLS